MKFDLIKSKESIDAQCGVCGQLAGTHIFDVVVVTDHGAEPLCDKCGDQHAPQLMVVRDQISFHLENPQGDI
jgi:hypothetical protein